MQLTDAQIAILHTMSKRHKIVLIIALTLITILGVAYTVRYEIRAAVSTTTARMSSPVSEEFPASDAASLSSLQNKIIDIAREEYAKKPISYDSNVLKYSQNVKQAWCANFISWLMNEAGEPLVNPHSGNWRIPGVYTLQEYYIDTGRYQLSTKYTPKVGDVAIYIGAQTSDPSSQEHTAIVVRVDGDTMTTLGGNEGGRMRLTTQKIMEGVNGLVGFGVLPESADAL